MILTLKLLGLATAALGAGIGLSGEARRCNKWTLRGRISLCLIIVGFIASFALDVLQYREKREGALDIISSDFANDRWEALQMLPIRAFEFTLLQRKELAPRELVNFLDGFSVIIEARLDRSSLPDGVPRKYTLLIALSQGRDSKVSALRLVAKAYSGGAHVAVGDPAMLWYKGTAPPAHEVYQRSLELDQMAGPAATSTSFLSETRPFPNGWTHTYLRDFDWTTPKAVCSGIRVRLQWRDIDFGGAVISAADLHKISIQVNPPTSLDRSLLDEMSLTLEFDDHFAERIELHAYSFGPNVKMVPFLMRGLQIFEQVKQRRKLEERDRLREYIRSNHR